MESLFREYLRLLTVVNFGRMKSMIKFFVT